MCSQVSKFCTDWFNMKFYSVVQSVGTLESTDFSTQSFLKPQFCHNRLMSSGPFWVHTNFWQTCCLNYSLDRIYPHSCVFEHGEEDIFSQPKKSEDDKMCCNKHHSQFVIILEILTLLGIWCLDLLLSCFYFINSCIIVLTSLSDYWRVNHTSKVAPRVE